MAGAGKGKTTEIKETHGLVEQLIVNCSEWAYLVYLTIFIYLIWTKRAIYFTGEGDWFMYAILGLLLFWTLPIGATLLSKFVMGKRLEYNILSGGSVKRFVIMMSVLMLALFALPMPSIALEFKLLLMAYFVLRIGTDFSNRFQIYENGLIWGGVCYRRGEIDSFKESGPVIEVYWKDKNKKNNHITRATAEEFKRIKKVLKDM